MTRPYSFLKRVRLPLRLLSPFSIGGEPWYCYFPFLPFCFGFVLLSQYNRCDKCPGVPMCKPVCDPVDGHGCVLPQEHRQAHFLWVSSSWVVNSFSPQPNRFNRFWTLGGTQFRAPDHLFANHLFTNLDPSFFCQFCSRRLPVAGPANAKLLAFTFQRVSLRRCGISFPSK